VEQTPNDPGTDVVAGGGSTLGDVANAAPGLARVAARAWWRTASWAFGSSLRLSGRIAQAAVSPDAASNLFDDARHEIVENARRALGVTDIEERVRRYAPDSLTDRAIASGTPPEDHVPADPNASLKEMGAALLSLSADVRHDDTGHPAYARILSELAADEARILRLLATEGAQASVDVRTAKPIPGSSQLVALGLTMIGAKAGCRHVDRVHAYLNNLFRLGLVWFSREQLEDPNAYQVLEAQPDVQAALREAGRAKTVRRSIHLTPFGLDFCRAALPLGDTELNTGQFKAVQAAAVAAADAADAAQADGVPAG
jgi:hypothetical protein